jgi:hypothetical protein
VNYRYDCDISLVQLLLKKKGDVDRRVLYKITMMKYLEEEGNASYNIYDYNILSNVFNLF